MQYFSLNFDSKGLKQSWVFPIPNTNLYQNISELTIPQSSQTVKLDQNNQVMIAITKMSSMRVKAKVER